MNYLTIYKDSISDGPGFRVSLYVSGCRNHCPGCHNPESWDFKAGKLFNNSTIEEIIGFCKENYIKGLTLAGGEPFEEENQISLLPFIKDADEEYEQYEAENSYDLYADFTNRREIENDEGTIQSQSKE